MDQNQKTSSERKSSRNRGPTEKIKNPDRQKERERRAPILQELHYLFQLVETGWPVHDDLFKYQGDLLGSGELPKYMYGMERRDFDECERQAEKNGIPRNIFRSRLHKGHHPIKASTMPYRPTKDRK